MRQGSPSSAAGAARVSPVVVWRAERLLAAGFDRELAVQVAAHRGFDVHAVLELVDRGCPPTLAARILAPLDGGSA